MFLVMAGILTANLRGQNTIPSIQFRDVTKSAGVTFTHYSGASGKKYLPETLGPGVAFIDYNGDGWQDLFFTNGKDWPGVVLGAATPSSAVGALSSSKPIPQR